VAAHWWPDLDIQVEIALGSLSAHLGGIGCGKPVMTQVQVSRSESRWATGALLALGIMLMGLLLSLPFLVRSLLFQPFNIPAG
jgi:hypothetical protein